MTTDILTLERGTIYRGNSGPYERTEARDIRVQFGRHAQYEQAVIITCTRKRARKRLEHTIFGGKIVILEGWGHPTPPSVWDKGASTFQIRASGVSVTAVASRNCMNDANWDIEFNSFLDAYLAEGKAKVAADLRNHDFKDTTGPRFSVRDLTPETPVIVGGVKNGQIMPQDQWEYGQFERYAPSQEFANLAEAQKAFPSLALKLSANSGFVGPTVDMREGKLWSTFYTIEHWNWYQSD